MLLSGFAVIIDILSTALDRISHKQLFTFTHKRGIKDMSISLV